MINQSTRNDEGPLGARTERENMMPLRQSRELPFEDLCRHQPTRNEHQRWTALACLQIMQTHAIGSMKISFTNFGRIGSKTRHDPRQGDQPGSAQIDPLMHAQTLQGNCR